LPQVFGNRELSWLAFNERVLEEAADHSTPLLDRVKFAAITASNLDEFFMVRVAGLKQEVADGKMTPDPSGLSPARQLDAVAERVHALSAALYELTRSELLPGLATAGILLTPWDHIDHGGRAALTAFFSDELLPVLTPFAIDVSRPFPILASLSLYLAVRLAPAPGEAEARLAIVPVPAGQSRLVLIAGGAFAFVLLEELIRAHLAQLFPGQRILESAVLRIARDAELEVDDEGGRTQLELVERELRRRRSSDVVRLEIERSTSPQLLRLLQEQFEIGPDETYLVDGPLDLRVLMALTELPGFEELREPPFHPADAVAAQQQADMFALIDDHDVLLHHPYDAYDPVLALVSQAADDPDVLAIKQTLYRTNMNSALVASLQRAAER
jgi:polyphosphate kinase